MRKKLLLPSAIAGVLILVFAVTIAFNHSAFAKNQQTNTKTAGMEKYADPKKKNDTKAASKSRLKQMNIVGETATVLNVLPITIIEEMQKGKTIAQIAKDKGLSEQEFTQKLSDLETEMVNNAVSKGTITQEHKEALVAGKTDRLKKALQTKGVDVNDHAAMDMGN
ncbi:hypothetical protein [Ectobacillus sp. sgz5001026]|uniref:hypothetical protein n=1 Tax=Ectobacillus sp. sgz5001026 TaxID=3242473 RepID=UPI0036D29C5C